MNTILKKFLIILIIILILVLVGLLVYNLLIKKPSEEKELGPGQLPPGEEAEFIPGEGEEGEEFIPSPESKIKAISTERVIAPTLSADKTKVIYYSQRNGKVWQSAFDGSGLANISSTVLNNLAEIIWSPDKTKAISIYQDDKGSISKYSYNYGTGQASSLGEYIREIAWSPNSSEIAYQYTNEATGDNNINIADPDGANQQKIAQIRMEDVALDWIDSDEIAFYEKPSGLVPSSLFLLNILSKDLTKVLIDTYGMTVKWSPQRDKFLYSKTNNRGGSIALYIALKDGTSEANTNTPTLVEKCVWSQDNRTVFCAVPKNIETAGILPDDFYKGSFVSDDEFLKINLETGGRSFLLEPWEKGEKTFDAVDLFLSPLEDYLFFVNKRDGLLYSIEL